MRHKKNIWSYFVLCMAVVFAGLMPTTAYGAADWPSEVAIEADGGLKPILVDIVREGMIP